jgi:hypothetical protein
MFPQRIEQRCIAPPLQIFPAYNHNVDATQFLLMVAETLANHTPDAVTYHGGF